MRGLLIAFCCLWMTGCNSLFYHPDALNWSLPEQISKPYTEHRISVGQRGETLHAWLFAATQSKKGTIVHFHGNAQNMSAHAHFASWLVAEGYDLLTFDYRGYGKSDGEVNRNNTIEDGIAVLNWISQRETSQPIFILGQSLGGAIAPVALRKASVQNVQGVVLESTFYSYRELAQRKLDSFFLTWALQWPLSYLISDESSPREHLKDMPWPTFVIHGNRDAVVPYSEGLKLAELLKRSTSSPVYFRTEIARGHTPCFISEQKSDCKAAVLNFLETSALAVNTRKEGLRP